MDIDMKEKDMNILEYDVDFAPNINLLISPISSLIHHLCPDISMIDNNEVNEEINYLKQEWLYKKWKSVIKCCQLLMQSTSSRNHEISTINYHISSVQDLLINNIKSHEIIRKSTHFSTLKIIFESNRDCIRESQFLTINQLLQFYGNLIIIQFKSGHYEIAQQMITNTMFQSEFFRKIFNKYIKSTNWSQIISFWRDNDNTDSMLKFLEKYNSMIRLFIIFISIQLKLGELSNFCNFKDIEWIIQYLMMQQTLNKYIKPIIDEIYILSSIYLMQQKKWNDSLLILNKCSIKNMPLSVFIKGWINFYISKYQESRKYFKQSAQSLSFGIAQSLNFFAFMCSKSKKYEIALNYLQKAIALTSSDNDNNNDNKSIYSFNWLQIYLLSNNQQICIEDISKILSSIKIGSNKCLFWEQAFLSNSEITKYSVSHIQSQINLSLFEYKKSRKEYEHLIGLISTLNIDEKQTLNIYQEYCCCLIGDNDWKSLSHFISKINRNDFQIDIVYIESLLILKNVNNINIIEEMKKIHSRYSNYSDYSTDKKTVNWWCRILSARYYEIIINNLNLAERNYFIATMDEPNCLLTMYFHTNIMRKMKNKHIETAICWLNFLHIPLNKNQIFYQNIIGNEINKYLSEKISIFNKFAINHKPSFCQNGLLFSYLFQQPQYKLNRLKLIEITKYCLSEWIKVITKMNIDPSLIQTFSMFQAK